MEKYLFSNISKKKKVFYIENKMFIKQFQWLLKYGDSHKNLMKQFNVKISFTETV